MIVPLTVQCSMKPRLMVLCSFKGKVHLTGYQMEDEDDELDESAFDSSMLDEASSDEEDEEGTVVVKETSPCETGLIKPVLIMKVVR